MIAEQNGESKRCLKGLRPAPETVSIAFTEAERCLLLSALAHFEDFQVRLAKVAKANRRFKEARARVETGKRILELSDRIEKEGRV
jgi:hypothetical protein